MKKLLAFFILVFGTSTILIAESASMQISYRVYYALEEFTNTCGPGTLSEKGRQYLNEISGNIYACDQHDFDYFTLGKSKEEADSDFYWNLKISEIAGNTGQVIAEVFWAAVALFGNESYRSAQAFSREAFRNIHHGREWDSYGRLWMPSDGHIQMSFPECRSGCY